MSQRKKIRDAFEDPEEWQTVKVSGPSSYVLEETGKTLTRSNSQRKRSVTKSASSSLTNSSEFLIPSLFVATASTPASPYASPRSSMHNIEPQKSPVPPQRSDSLRRSAPNFIPPPPSTPHPSTIRRPSQSPLATSPIGSPKSNSLFHLDDYDDDDDDMVPNLNPTYRVEILHTIVAADFDSPSALLSRSTSTLSKDNTSLRLLLHPLLPVTWRLCGSQRKNNALYCIETSLPAVDRLVYIEETWQVINDKNPLQKTFVGKHAILLACSIPSLIACASPLAFNDRAIDCLVKIYLEANTDQLNPFLILMGGKSFKIPLRQAIAKHLFSIGFAVHHVHWHGLSTTADSTFVTHIAEIWTKSCKQ